MANDSVKYNDYWELQAHLRSRDLAMVTAWLRDPRLAELTKTAQRLQAYSEALSQDSTAGTQPMWTYVQLQERSARIRRHIEEERPSSTASTVNKHRSTAGSQDQLKIVQSSPVKQHPSCETDKSINTYTTIMPSHYQTRALDEAASGHQEKPLVMEGSRAMKDRNGIVDHCGGNEGGSEGGGIANGGRSGGGKRGGEGDGGDGGDGGGACDAPTKDIRERVRNIMEAAGDHSNPDPACVQVCSVRCEQSHLHFAPFDASAHLLNLLHTRATRPCISRAHD